MCNGKKSFFFLSNFAHSNLREELRYETTNLLCNTSLVPTGLSTVNLGRGVR